MMEQFEPDSEMAMSDMRTKLFVSYSKGDTDWRSSFRGHLRTLVKSEDLWIDHESIPAGSRFEDEIAAGIAKSRCALILLTKQYLDLEHFARYELDRLIAEQSRGLKLLPVLVEECAWKSVPQLDRLQLVSWPGDTWMVHTDSGRREDLRPLDRAENRERAVREICEQVVKELGVLAQATPIQIDALVAGIRLSLGQDVELKPVHSGDFSVVYQARRGDQVFAVKAVPDTPRQNRIRAIVDEEMPKAMALRDPSFIRLRDVYREHEPHCVIMDYVDAPTLELRLAEQPDHRLAPMLVAKVLVQVARAQREAHGRGLQLGPIRPSSIHVDDNWSVQLSPLRVGDVLARAGYGAGRDGINWDALTHLAPEAGHGSDLPPTDLDALEQYYLALLGLQLVLGRAPCEVRCFDDLSRKARFFDDPRSFFLGDCDVDWTDEGPALAFVLARMLARDPAKRLPYAAIEELTFVAQGRLPSLVRAQLRADRDEVMKPSFGIGFYDRLFKNAREGLKREFKKGPEARAGMLARAIPELINFDPDSDPDWGFKDTARTHAGKSIEARDIEAFRVAFLDQVDTVFGNTAAHRDAWNAALRLGLAHLSAFLHETDGAAVQGRSA